MPFLSTQLRLIIPSLRTHCQTRPEMLTKFLLDNPIQSVYNVLS